jgi:dihydroorotase
MNDGSATTITIRRPDDWHVHLRDGAMLRAVLPHTAGQFARACIMPNLVPPVRTAADASSYRERILAALPPGRSFQPMMTIYLTDDTDPADLVAGHAQGVVFAAKLYPAHATTNSQHGVTDFSRLDRVLAAMERAGVPLLVHGEVTGADVDVFDREAVFIERRLAPIRGRFPGLRITLEHVTTIEGVEYVKAAGELTAATVTPHHLVINRNAIFEGGIRPHYYCLPVAKREKHRRALRAVVASGHPRFFLGTDTAPHLRSAKESACGCAGVFNAPTALAVYAQAFEEEGALDRLEAFASLNGARFYHLPPNEGYVRLAKKAWAAAEDVELPDGTAVHIFLGGSPQRWSLSEADVILGAPTQTFAAE